MGYGGADLKKKALAVVLCMSLVPGLLCGCGNGGQATKENQNETSPGEPAAEVPDKREADNGEVTLKIWAEEANFEMLTQMIDSFKEAHKGEADFEIVLEESPDNATKDNVLGDIHNAADIFPFADDQLSALVAAGALEPVYDQEAVRTANLEEAVEAAAINDIIYAYPMTADNGYFLYYDKDYFTEEDVKTMDGILAVCEANGKQFTMEWDSGWYLYSFFGNTGLEFGINDDGVTNYCNWNITEGTVKGVDIAQALLAISASPAFLSQPDSEFPAAIASGQVIAGVSGVWNAIEVKNAWGKDYGACKLPTYTCKGQQIQMSSFTGYKMMGVNAYSAHKEWALLLADWLTNEQNQTVRFEQRDQGPSNIKAAASDAVKQVPAIQAVIAQGEFGRLQRVGNNFWMPFVDFGTVMAAGNPDGKDLQELMDELVTGVTASTVQ